MAEGRSRGLVTWARAHVAAAAGLTVAGVVVLVAVIAALVGAASSGSSTPPVAAGSIVQSGPLTTGYRITGLVKAHAATTVTVSITAVEFAAPEARNVVLFSGQVITFEQPTQGVVAVARNGHRLSGPDKLHTGDKVTLVGEFATVGAPPGRQGYAFFGIEATSH